MSFTTNSDRYWIARLVLTIDLPDILVVITAWWITFTVVLILLFVAIGFNVPGIGVGQSSLSLTPLSSYSKTIVTCQRKNANGVLYDTGTLAAAFQSWAYGGFTPAGGVFATLTSWGMLGYLAPVQTVVATLVASAVAVGVWALGVGR